jgi:toxin-antitoxin system PIN domain toxin
VRLLLDVNVLLALFDPGHSQHAHMRAWWSRRETEGWASCPLTQNGFVRILSTPGYARPMTVAGALAALAELTALPGHEFWPDSISIGDTTTFDRRYLLGPNQITDVYLLALAVKNGGQLVTLDRAVPISAVRGAEPHHIAVL